MPKYELAFYLSEFNHWEKVSFKELESEEKRAELREMDLREKINGIYQLGIRNHPQTPHFFQKRPIRNNIEKGVVESEEHEKQKKMVCAFLNKYPKQAFGYYERPWNSADKGYESLIKVKDYLWDKEVRFGLVYGKYIQFDILGHSKNDLSLTDKLPYIAIKIIDTYFHSKETFKALLELTKNIPVIVLYIFVPKIPILNCVKIPKQSNSFSQNRIKYYLADGSFWIQNNRIEDEDHLDDISPNKPEIYYNLIRERLYREGCFKNYN